MPNESNNTLRIILDRLFDYAGMFPPASRSFEDALQESSSFRSKLKRPWMVGSDLVLDTEHARKLVGVNLGIYTFTHPIRVCLLATEDPESVISTALELGRKEPKIEISSLETKASPGAIPETLEHYGSFLSSGGISLGVEPNLSGDDWESVLDSAVKALSDSPLRPALKCRLTGPSGITPDRFASALIAATDAGLPLKVTGGLHHPIVERERYGFPMGFLNVACAVMFRRVLGTRVSHAALVELLTNADPAAFEFGETLQFTKLRLSAAELRHVKGSAPFTIGSCSIHEPDQDLSRLFGDAGA
jgi:hypothetical protein